MSSPVSVRRAARALVVAAVLLGSVGAQAASAVTVRVDDDGAQCPDAQFRRINAALGAVTAGGTVLVCPGVYVGPVRINKNGVRVAGLTGRRADVSVIPALDRPDPNVELSAPATALAAVTVRERSPLSVFSDVCGPPVSVLVDNGPGPAASASVIDNITVRQRSISVDSPCSGGGVGVSIGAGAVPGRAIVRNSTLSGHDGVDVQAGSTADIHDNVIRNALVLHDGGTGVGVNGGDARIEHNNVSTSNGGVGVGVFAGHATVGGPGGGNNLHDNDIGVVLGEGADATVANNLIRNSRSGMLIASRDGVVSGNRMTANQLDGIEVDVTASGNRFLGNVATHNGDVDCLDVSTGTGTAGTANTWIDNIGVTSSPPGICLPPGS